MGHLTNLVKIDLSHCNLSGTIPLHLHTLTSLELMDLSQNSLSGRVPDFLVSLPKLTHLNLSYNQFDATLSTTQMHSSAKLLLASQEGKDT
jgi:Leucine-rich repeat (LRR) protein